MEETLIKAVKKHEVLYKKNSLSYKNKFKRAAAWKSIAEELNVSENICQARWKTLRDRYVKKHSENKNASGGTAELEGNQWQYYEQMEFLREHIKPRKTCPNDLRKKGHERNIRKCIKESNIEEQLIEAVKEHEVLYKRNSLAYRNKFQRAAAWKSIAEELNVPENVCQARWKTLRDRFVKKHAEIQHASGIAAEFEGNQWQYYEQMEFLREHIKLRKTVTSLTSLHDKNTDESSTDAQITILKDEHSGSIESLVHTSFLDEDVLNLNTDSPPANTSTFLESSFSQLPNSSRKRTRREADNDAFGEFLNKMLKIAKTRFSVPLLQKESGSHEGFFSMVREIFEDLPSDVVKDAKFFFINYLREVTEKNK